MKKTSFLLFMTASMTLSLMGCGKRIESTENEYTEMVELVGTKGHLKTIETPENSEKVTLTYEATGKEKIEEREVIEKTQIYSKPNKEANVLGSVSEGSKVSVIGILEDKKWYKMVTNGRVAYISANAIKTTDSDQRSSTSDRISTEESSESERPSEISPKPEHPSATPSEPDNPSATSPEPDNPSATTPEPDNPSEAPSEPEHPSEAPSEPDSPSGAPSEPDNPSEAPSEPETPPETEGDVIPEPEASEES